MKLSDEIKDFVDKHINADVRSLALQSKRYPFIDIPFAIRQIAGRQIAKQKIPSWFSNPDIIYPQGLSMEQCSSESTALFKAGICGGNTMVDLTGGFGVDFSFLSTKFKKAVYVEQQTELAEIAESNFKALGLDNVEAVITDSVSYLQDISVVDLIYIDPARRAESGRKTVSIEDCTPNLIEIDDLLTQKAKKVMIKLSPMLDISRAAAQLRNISDVYVISANNECKELLFVKQQQAVKQINIHCINIRNSATDEFIFTKEEEENLRIPYTSSLDTYLYEPNASILKAGAYKSIAQKYSVNKLHPSSHLYTSPQLIYDFPGRVFEIINTSTINKKEIKENFSGMKNANVSTRNFLLTPDELKKRLGLKDGGETYLFGTTLADESKVAIICKKA